MSVIFKLLGQKSGSDVDPNYSEGLKKIEETLSSLPEDQARFLSSLALLLGRIAYADLEISDAEKVKMKEILKTQAALDDAKADLVCAISIERTLLDAVDNHIVLRQMNDLATKEQKRQVLSALFSLAMSEDISETESDEIRKIAMALGYSHTEFIELRSEFREHLSILK